MISDGILGILCLDMIHDDHSHRAHKTQLTQILKKNIYFSQWILDIHVARISELREEGQERQSSTTQKNVSLVGSFLG